MLGWKFLLGRWQRMETLLFWNTLHNVDSFWEVTKSIWISVFPLLRKRIHDIYGIFHALLWIAKDCYNDKLPLRCNCDDSSCVSCAGFPELPNADLLCIRYVWQMSQLLKLDDPLTINVYFKIVYNWEKNLWMHNMEGVRLMCWALHMYVVWLAVGVVST